MRTRLPLRALLCALFLVICAGCPTTGAETPQTQSAAFSFDYADRVARIDSAQARALRYLLAHQSPDGTWRSATYGFLKDGPSLTAHIADCVQVPGPDAARIAFESAANYLAGLAEDDDALDKSRLIYSVYTSAETVRVLTRMRQTSPHREALERWRKYLRSQQLNGANGWRESDQAFGGWSFAASPPHRPAAGQVAGEWDWSNLSSTRDALSALRAAGVPSDDPCIRDAQIFVFRCQNYEANPPNGDAVYDDGGFFFSPATIERERNKAGIAGVDSRGRQRFHSYGSMTVDGIRALLDAGVPIDDPRIVAARRWLAQNFSAEHNPGSFDANTEDLRDATFYYYTNGLAEVMGRLNSRAAPASGGTLRWGAALADELISRQRPDGSWINRFSDAREDDPLVATPTAYRALAYCRRDSVRRER